MDIQPWIEPITLNIKDIVTTLKTNPDLLQPLYKKYFKCDSRCTLNLNIKNRKVGSKGQYVCDECNVLTMLLLLDTKNQKGILNYDDTVNCNIINKMSTVSVGGVYTNIIITKSPMSKSHTYVEKDNKKYILANTTTLSLLITIMVNEYIPHLPKIFNSFVCGADIYTIREDEKLLSDIIMGLNDNDLRNILQQLTYILNTLLKYEYCNGDPNIKSLCLSKTANNFPYKSPTSRYRLSIKQSEYSSINVYNELHQPVKICNTYDGIHNTYNFMPCTVSWEDNKTFIIKKDSINNLIYERQNGRSLYPCVIDYYCFIISMSHSSKILNYIESINFHKLLVLLDRDWQTIKKRINSNINGYSNIHHIMRCIAGVNLNSRVLSDVMSNKEFMTVV